MIALISQPMVAAAGYSLRYLLGGGGFAGAIMVFIVAIMKHNGTNECFRGAGRQSRAIPTSPGASVPRRSTPGLRSELAAFPVNAEFLPLRSTNQY